MWNLKEQYEFIYKINTDTDIENKIRVTKGGQGWVRRAGVGARASCIPSSVLWFSRVFPGLLAALRQQ